MAPVILLTRPDADAARFAELLHARLPDASVEVSPLMDIQADGALPDMADVDGLIFTSRNAVQAYRDLKGPCLPCYCVGEATAQAARDAGMQAVAAQGTGEALADRMLADRPAGHWLHLHGEHVRTDVAAVLRAGGMRAAAHPIYRQTTQGMTPRAQALLNAGGPVVLPVFSPRSGRILRPSVRPEFPHYIVSISGAAAGIFADWPRDRLLIAPHPDAPSMTNAVLRAFETAARVEGGGTAH